MQLRDYFTKEIRSESDETSNNAIGIIVDAYKQKGPWAFLPSFGGKWGGNNALHKSKKWEAELQIQITEEEWYQMYM